MSTESGFDSEEIFPELNELDESHDRLIRSQTMENFKKTHTMMLNKHKTLRLSTKRLEEIPENCSDLDCFIKIIERATKRALDERENSERNEIMFTLSKKVDQIAIVQDICMNR